METEQRKITLYIDGAARGNPGPAGISYVIYGGNGKVIAEDYKYIGEKTNNEAEYSAFIFALQKVTGIDPEMLTVYSDSNLLVNQVSGGYKVKNDRIKVLHAAAMKLLRKLSGYEIMHVERSKNKEADRLANKAIDDYMTGDAELFTIQFSDEEPTLF